MEIPRSVVSPVSSVVKILKAWTTGNTETQQKKSVHRVLGEEAARHADWTTWKA